MSQFSININLETSSERGEDCHLFYERSHSDSITIAVFDGLGGRSSGFNGLKGGQIASQIASQRTKKLLEQWSSSLTEDFACTLQTDICRVLKEKADANMPKSRLTGKLAGKRLCTTMALASFPKTKINNYVIDVIWIGDSRIYFLSPQKGLQQLTNDDLEVEKDSFEMIREDPPMSQYFTADFPSDWKIHHQSFQFQEDGCIIACTDGCFQYLPTPWDFEKLLLETLAIAQTPKEWEDLLSERYQQIKQDDVSLFLYPISQLNFEEIKSIYKIRLAFLLDNYSHSDSLDFNGLKKLWLQYKKNYEEKIQRKINNAYPTVESTEDQEVLRDKKNDSSISNEDQRRIDYELLQADNHAKYGRLNEAIQGYKKILCLSPEHFLAKQYLAKVSERHLEICYNRKKYNEVVMYSDVYKMFDDRYLMMIAFSFLELNHYELALNFCESAFETKTARIKLLMGYSYYMLNQLEASEELLNDSKKEYEREFEVSQSKRIRRNTINSVVDELIRLVQEKIKRNNMNSSTKQKESIMTILQIDL